MYQSCIVIGKYDSNPHPPSQANMTPHTPNQLNMAPIEICSFFISAVYLYTCLLLYLYACI